MSAFEVPHPHVALDDAADGCLLLVDVPRRINDGEAEAAAHFLILCPDAVLEDAEALVGIGAPAHVEAGFVEFQLRAPVEDAAEDDIERCTEVECQIGHRREGVDALDPGRIHAADDIAGEGGEDVAVGEDEVSGFQQGQDLPLIPVGKVGGVDEGKGGRCEELPGFALAGARFDEAGGVPLREEHARSGEFQPALDEIDLG